MLGPGGLASLPLKALQLLLLQLLQCKTSVLRCNCDSCTSLGCACNPLEHGRRIEVRWVRLPGLPDLRRCMQRDQLRFYSSLHVSTPASCTCERIDKRVPHTGKLLLGRLPAAIPWQRAKLFAEYVSDIVRQHPRVNWASAGRRGSHKQLLVLVWPSTETPTALEGTLQPKSSSNHRSQASILKECRRRQLQPPDQMRHRG